MIEHAAAAPAALALALALAGAQDPAEAGTAPGERQRIDGIEGLLAVSTLTYDAAPDHPHELVAMYAFPDRAKWHLSLIGGHSRRIEYRSGEACWSIDPGGTDSRRLEGIEREHQVRRLELRRALLLWPHGFDWTWREGRWRAELGAFGHLEAEAPATVRPADGLPGEPPTSLGSFDDAGLSMEVLGELAWAPRGGRLLPARARLFVEGSPVWTESFTEVSVHASFLDHSFIPPDRLGPLEELPVQARTRHVPQAAPAPEVVQWRSPLPAGLPWKRAIERARTLRAEALRSLDPGAALAPGLEFELSPGGRPAAVVLTLADSVADPGDEAQPPAGWTAVPAHRRLQEVLEAFPRAGDGGDGDPGGLSSVLERLRAAAPKDLRPGPARLWLDPEAPVEARGLRLTLPLFEGPR